MRWRCLQAAGLMGPLAFALAGCGERGVTQATADGEVTLVTADEGRTTHSTIAAALESATDGDTILLSPGTYSESVTVDRAVTLAGDGPRGEIVIESDEAHAIRIDTGGAQVRGLTARCTVPVLDTSNDYAALVITQGESIVEDCDLSSPAYPGLIVMGSGANPTVRDSIIRQSGYTGVMLYEGNSVTLERCRVMRNARAGISVSDQSHLVARDCLISGNSGDGIYIRESSTALITSCEITTNHGTAIQVESGANPTVRGCTMHTGSSGGVFVHDGGLGTFEDCEIYDHARSNVVIQTGGNPTFRRCRIHGGLQAGVYALDNGAGRFESCEIFDSARHNIDVRQYAAPHFVDCDIHGGRNQSSVMIGNWGNPVFRQCRIRTSPEHGVETYLYGMGLFEDCEITENAIAGVLMHGCADTQFNRTRIVANGQTGVLGTHLGRGRFVECEIADHPLNNLSLGDICYPVFTSCSITGAGRNGVWAHSGSHATFENCKILNSSWSGVTVRTGARPTIRGSRIRGSGAQGVRVHSAAAATVTDCSLTGNASGSWAVDPSCWVTESGNVADTPPRAAGATGSAPPLVFSVSSSEEADFNDLSEALQFVPDGSTVLVHPGSHEAAVRILFPVSVAGAGPREDVLIHSERTTPIRVDGQGVTLRGLTIQCLRTQNGPEEFDNAVYVYGGGATIDDCTLSSAGGGALAVCESEGRAQVLNCLLRGSRNGGLYVGRGGQADLTRTVITENPWSGAVIDNESRAQFLDAGSHRIRTRECGPTRQVPGASRTAI